ncbi:NGG1p interacting factor NIF3 [Thiomicrorhabdus sediminis]|uniref:NGG1p interacting factor NIF3 n=1 Tax=Thiomicrorhabdus sediminis TaxID=2580412 RepID=A0A4P9K5Y8_9GAMM|nr:NGG1p interacting factor NIF3 [Thiomicrorhabdus sediminis]QCU90422.1 NGG1p interacting factor NIF3 [Thiomicrorhabdus sediminis]
MADRSLYKLTVFIPETHLEQVKQAMFAAGGGVIGNYDNCSWQVKGQGQFRALPGSSAFIGELNELAVVDEYRVELVVEKSRIKAVIAALKSAHPYETPAFDVLEVISEF